MPPSAVMMSSGIKPRNKTIRIDRGQDEGKDGEETRGVVGEATCCVTVSTSSIMRAAPAIHPDPAPIQAQKMQQVIFFRGGPLYIVFRGPSLHISVFYAIAAAPAGAGLVAHAFFWRRKESVGCFPGLARCLLAWEFASKISRVSLDVFKDYPVEIRRPYSSQPASFAQSVASDYEPQMLSKLPKLLALVVAGACP